MNGVEKATRAFSDIVAVPTGALILVAAIKLPEALAWLAFGTAVFAEKSGFIGTIRDLKCTMRLVAKVVLRLSLTVL